MKNAYLGSNIITAGASPFPSPDRTTKRNITSTMKARLNPGPFPHLLERHLYR